MARHRKRWTQSRTSRTPRRPRRSRTSRTRRRPRRSRTRRTKRCSRRSTAEGARRRGRHRPPDAALRGASAAGARTRHLRLSARLPALFAVQRSSTVPEVRIAAEPRTEFGKGPSRRVRRAGLPGGSQLALPKAIQRDAIKGSVEHVDLIMVRRGEKVTVDVPVTVTGDVAPDGLLDQQLVQIAVEAEATNIPPGIEVDVEGMAIGMAVHAGDLRLPAGVSLADEPDVLVLHVIAAPTAAEIEAELGEVAEAPEAAPAAPAAPAAAAEGGQAEAAPE